jgi:hypothetical protein
VDSRGVLFLSRARKENVNFVASVSKCALELAIKEKGESTVGRSSLTFRLNVPLSKPLNGYSPNFV